MYFGVLKRLGWVEATGKTEASSIKENYSPAPERIYYRITKKGVEAGDELWSNPLFTLYPEIGPSHMKAPDWLWVIILPSKSMQYLIVNSSSLFDCLSFHSRYKICDVVVFALFVIKVAYNQKPEL